MVILSGTKRQPRGAPFFTIGIGNAIEIGNFSCGTRKNSKIGLSQPGAFDVHLA